MNMAQPTPNAIWNIDENQLLELLNSEKLVQEPRKIRFYAPSFTHYKTAHFCSSTTDFPTLSITGTSCSLNCKHCQGKVLQTMQSATSPERLLKLSAELRSKGAKGILISGGCTPNGRVPIQKFASPIARIKKELELTVFVHTGIIDKQEAEQLKNAGVDAALIDVIGSDETINQICNLQITTQDYANSLQALSQAQLPFIPHVVTGLHHGILWGELNALNIIAQTKPAAIVIIAFMPIRGTAMEKTAPPTPQDIARVAAAARVMFPKTPVVLGCMRPKGKHRQETDVLCLKAGVNAVAFPTEEAIQYAKTRGYTTAFSPFCCAQIYRDAIQPV